MPLLSKRLGLWMVAKNLILENILVLVRLQEINPALFLLLKPLIFCLKSAAVFGFSISIFRFLLISKYSVSLSIPKNLRLFKLAAIPVVELPEKGSKIHALGLVDARIILVKTDNGFWVGCLPQFFLNSYYSLYSSIVVVT